MTKKQTNQYIKLAAIGVLVAAVAIGIFLIAKPEPKMTRDEYLRKQISLQEQVVANAKEQTSLVSKKSDCQSARDNYQEDTYGIDCDRVLARWDELKAQDQALQQQIRELNEKAQKQGL